MYEELQRMRAENGQLHGAMAEAQALVQNTISMQMQQQQQHQRMSSEAQETASLREREAALGRQVQVHTPPTPPGNTHHTV
jgi:hypothetical protein